MTRDDAIRETFKHVRRVGTLMLDAISNLQQRAMRHDNSKFDPDELDGYIEATINLKGLTYGSEEYKECLRKIKPTVDLHYKKNNHHPEHYPPPGIHRMDLMTLIEMLADWKAASERHANGNLVDSIVHNAKRFGYDDKFACLLARTAANLGWISEMDYNLMPKIEETAT